MNKSTKRIWRNRIIFVSAVAAIVIGYLIYINSATIYDPSHLTRRMISDEGQEFVPLTAVGGGQVSDMVRAAETPYIALYVSLEDTTFAIYDKRNGAIWHSSPQGPETIANPHHRGIMRSNFGFSFFDRLRRRQHRWMYTDSARFGDEQFSIHSISYNGMPGIRFEYMVGDMDIGLHFIPRYLPIEKFEEIRDVMAEDDPAAAFFFRNAWRESQEREDDDESGIVYRPGFMRLAQGLFDNAGQSRRMLNYFDLYFQWTLEMTQYYNALSGYVPEIEFEYFTAIFEIFLDRDRMIVNVPISEIQVVGEFDASFFALDILRFFGAGCRESEGFMVVPSGAGGVINFNNGMYREPAFASRVYGDDFINNFFFSQIEQPARLPVIGINNNGFGMVAHVVNGQGLATVNAEVAAETVGMGGTTAQNNAWFSFILRESVVLDMSALAAGTPGTGLMTLVQEEAYDGDITIVYHFLPQENPTVGDMAQAYQQFLVEEGALTPLPGPGDRSFYLDILGGIDARAQLLGTPYDTLRTMTDMDDMHRIVDILNTGGVKTVQLQLHGWFNRGINHDVANRVNLITEVANRNELQEMNDRLQQNGGGLHPVVNFQLTNYYSRRFNRTLESARTTQGFIGFMSRLSRDMMFTLTTIHRNDWFILVHPGRVPHHVDDFIPAFERRVGIDSLALADLGGIVTESMHRRNPVNREHAQGIAAQQIARLYESFPNLVVFGGNDYALGFASHVVDAPIETDRFFIIDYDVPFFSMVLHGFIEFAGAPSNMREDFNSTQVLLNSMRTGASPRYVLTAQPTRHMQFSPHERFYSTHYVQWMDQVISHYNQFNDVYRYLRGERIVDFEILHSRADSIHGMARQVSVTVFSNGTRIYVNQTEDTFEHNGVLVPANWFVVREA
ncbi:MAG: DUF5696 domain-containing protein [Defluviitaleaceae bacterium]|nr:DUF5696 domain-containing protein [Defluviitaleaceae bacterium]